MNDLDRLVRDLRGFDGRREVTKQMAKEIRKPVPGARKAVRKRATDTLPKRGGLNKWVAKARVSASIKVLTRSASVKLKGSRKSLKNKSDMTAIDRGRVRHPSFGRRGPGQWFTQTVTPGWFTKPAGEIDQWHNAVVAAVDKALRSLR